MKTKTLLLCMCLLPFKAFGQEAKTSENKSEFTPYYKYRVSLIDKDGCGYSLDKPEAFLSAKSIERRKNQNLPLDESDLPVSKKYLKGITKTGAKVLHTSKWNNTVLVQLTDTTLADKLMTLPYVTEVRKVATYTKPTKEEGNNRQSELSSLKETPVSVIDDESKYGKGFNQINMLGGISLHNNGYRGEGMTIAIIDGGFYNTDIIPLLQHVKILGTKDFVDLGGDVFSHDTHGTMVLSCIAANTPGLLVGTAPDASFYLLRSEDGDTEQLVEEDNWCAAIEYADSVGVDVVNTSLGYTTFDNAADNVLYREQDGHTHLCSRSASMAASKGMVLCHSAGNSGNKEWKRIGVPADADHILSVGALNPNGTNANFSSVGYSADGRVKPDVCAQGVLCAVIGGNGRIRTANGTSFSSPILCGMVACFWQSHPELTAEEVMELIRSLGDRYAYPDNVYGYGTPQFERP